MTPQAGSGPSDARGAPAFLLVPLYLLPLIVASLTPTADFLGGPQGDVALYLDKARSIVAGLTPYRDFPLEYPPFSLLPMVLPAVLWPFGPMSIEQYPWLFAGEMGVLLVVMALVVRRIVPLRVAVPVAGAGAGTGRGRAATGTGAGVAREQRDVAVRMLLLSVGAALALTWRFDLFPALLAVVAVWASLERRPALAGVAIGIGILVKLFPLAVAPAVAVAWLAPLDRGGLARFAGVALVVLVVGMLPFLALAGPDALVWLGYQTARGLQIESVGGGLVLLSGLLGGHPIGLDAPYSAWEVTGPVARDLLALTSGALVLGFAGLAALGWRRMRADQAREGTVTARTIVDLATASVLLLVVTSKVFSIQYVVWILPFAAMLPWRRFWLAAAAFSLTIPIHPVLYERLVAQETLPILILNARNGLLVALLAWLLWDLSRGNADRSPPPEKAAEPKAESSTAASGLERP